MAFLTTAVSSSECLCTTRINGRNFKISLDFRVCEILKSKLHMIDAVGSTPLASKHKVNGMIVRKYAVCKCEFLIFQPKLFNTKLVDVSRRYFLVSDYSMHSKFLPSDAKRLKVEYFVVYFEIVRRVVRCWD